MSVPTAIPAVARSRALGMLVLATLFWGLSFPLIKAMLLLHAQLAPAAGSSFLTAYVLAPRFALGALVIAACQWRGLGDIRRDEWKQGVAIGLFSAAGMLFQNDGLQFTSASTSAFLTQFYAILIPVFVAVRVRKIPGITVWVCGLLVLAGVAVLGRFDWHELRFGRGEIETIIASGFFTGQILLLDRPEFAANRPGRITLTMFLTQALICTALLPVFAPADGLGEALAAPWRSGTWVGMTLILTLVCTVGAYSLMNAWQPKISATEAGLIYCAEPIFGSLLALCLPAWFAGWAAVDYPNETATWTLVIGGGLITLANVLIQLKPPVPTPAATDADNHQ